MLRLPKDRGGGGVVLSLFIYSYSLLLFVDKGWREGSHLETNNGRNRVVSSIFSFLVLEDEETEAQIY